MNNAARGALTWFGRLCLLAVPFLFICGLTYPKGIAPLDPLICPDGLSVETSQDPGEGTIDRITSYEVRCSSETRLVVATSRLYGLMAIAFVLAIGAYVLRNSLEPDELSAPHAPPQH